MRFVSYFSGGFNTAIVAKSWKGNWQNAPLCTAGKHTERKNVYIGLKKFNDFFRRFHECSKELDGKLHFLHATY